MVIAKRQPPGEVLGLESLEEELANKRGALDVDWERRIVPHEEALEGLLPDEEPDGDESEAGEDALRRGYDYDAEAKTTRTPVTDPRKGRSLGGNYYRKVPGEDGKARYYYSPEAYHKRPDAHPDGAFLRPKPPEPEKVGDPADVRAVLQQLFAMKGPAGLHMQDLVPVVRTYGAVDVGLALKKLGVVHIADRVLLKKPSQKAQEPSRMRKSETFGVTSDPIQKALLGAPGAPDVTGVSGPMVSGDNAGAAARRLPVGSRRIWNNRVVEKKEDNKWHVVGKAKDGMIAASKATREQAQKGPGGGQTGAGGGRGAGGGKSSGGESATGADKPGSNGKGGSKASPSGSGQAAPPPQEKWTPEHPQLMHGALSKEELAHLVRQVLRLHHAAKEIRERKESAQASKGK